MAGIKAPLQDVLALLASMPITNDDGSATTPYVRVWNDQLKLDENGEMESFPKPAYFVEPMSPMIFEVIGQGYRSCDVNWRIHIVHEYYNDADGVTYEQDLKVFDLRDQVLALLTYFTPTACGPMTCVSEHQDTNHKNLYHFELDFPCNFTDSKGSRLDELRNYFITKQPPTDADISGTVEVGGAPLIQTFIIPER